MRQPEQKIYLASKSPRRRELLRQIGIEFELLLLRDQAPRGPDVNEDVHPGELPQDYVARVTNEKAAFAWAMMLQRKLPLRPVLAADTTVVIDGNILGKPASTNEAVDYDAASIRAHASGSDEHRTPSQPALVATDPDLRRQFLRPE